MRDPFVLPEMGSRSSPEIRTLVPSPCKPKSSPGGISAIGSTGILVQLGSLFSTPGSSSCTKMVFGPTPTVEPGGDCRQIRR